MERPPAPTADFGVVDLDALGVTDLDGEVYLILLLKLNLFNLGGASFVAFDLLAGVLLIFPNDSA